MSINIIGIIGSMRSNHKNVHELKSFVLNSNTQAELQNCFKSSKLVFSNSDIIMTFALLGAKLNGAEIEIYSLTNLFPKLSEKLYDSLNDYLTVNDLSELNTLAIDANELNKFINLAKISDGVILASPVYFGDRSSVANKFFQIAKTHALLEGKTFGVISSGAKRNGGQETTNIYSLNEALSLGAVVLGNGPKSSQYGGTVVAGDPAVALKDESGLETCLGTGKQVSQCAIVLQNGKKHNKKEKLNIVILSTMDTNQKKYQSILSEYFSKYQSDQVNIKIISLIDSEIYRCLACSVCPNPKFREKNGVGDKRQNYNCIIQTSRDAMIDIRDLLKSSDGLIIAGVNSKEDLIYRYQAFMERTRFIRREDFELTNYPIMGMLVSEVGSYTNEHFNLKVMTSFIRHNSFMLKAMHILIHNSKTLYADSFDTNLQKIQEIKAGRKITDSIEVSYKAIGYQDVSLDSSVAKRN